MWEQGKVKWGAGSKSGQGAEQLGLIYALCQTVNQLIIVHGTMDKFEEWENWESILRCSVFAVLFDLWSTLLAKTKVLKISYSNIRITQA